MFREKDNIYWNTGKCVGEVKCILRCNKFLKGGGKYNSSFGSEHIDDVDRIRFDIEELHTTTFLVVFAKDK